MSDELTSEQITELIKIDRAQREREMLEILQRESQRLRVKVEAVIESLGQTAVARLVVTAQ